MEVVDTLPQEKGAGQSLPRDQFWATNAHVVTDVGNSLITKWKLINSIKVWFWPPFFYATRSWVCNTHCLQGLQCRHYFFAGQFKPFFSGNIKWSVAERSVSPLVFASVWSEGHFPRGFSHPLKLKQSCWKIDWYDKCLDTFFHKWTYKQQNSVSEGKLIEQNLPDLVNKS